MRPSETRELKTHAALLLFLVALLVTSYAALVAREDHATAFERDCPACRLSSAGLAEQPVEIHHAVPIVTLWYASSERSWATPEPLVFSDSIRAPPV